MALIVNALLVVVEKLLDYAKVGKGLREMMVHGHYINDDDSSTALNNFPT